MNEFKSMTLDNVVQTIIGGVFLALLGFVGKFLNSKIDCKLDKEVYEAKHEAVLRELLDGKKRFEIIEKELRLQTRVLHDLDTTAKLIVSKIDKTKSIEVIKGV